MGTNGTHIPNIRANKTHKDKVHKMQIISFNLRFFYFSELSSLPKDDLD